MHAFLGTPLIAPGFAPAFWRAFRETLSQAWWSGYIRIRAIPTNGPAGQALIAQCHAGRTPHFLMHEKERAFLTVPKDADAYWQGQLRDKKR